MKRTLFGILGLMVALALAAGAPGMAGATPVATTITLSGPGSADFSSYTWNTGSLTITEAAPIAGIVPAWMLVDTSDNLGAYVTNGTVQITGTQVFLTGTLESLTSSATVGSFTDVPGTLLAFTNNNGYTWNASFPSLTALGNTVFGVSSGTFKGSLGFSSNGTTSPAVSMSSNLTAVPIPPAVLLLCPGLLCLAALRKRLPK